MRQRLAIVLLFWAAAISAAEIKRWVDPDGQVHFGDVAPPTVEAEVREVEEQEPDSTGGSGMRPGELEMIRRFEQRGQAREEARHRSARASEKDRQNAKKEEKRKARCQYHRAKLEQALRKKRRGYTRAQGERLKDKIELNELKVNIYCD